MLRWFEAYATALSTGYFQVGHKGSVLLKVGCILQASQPSVGRQRANCTVNRRSTSMQLNCIQPCHLLYLAV